MTPHQVDGLILIIIGSFLALIVLVGLVSAAIAWWERIWRKGQ